MEQPRLLLINGPNLNRLGVRSPELYGRVTLAEIQAMVQEEATHFDVIVEAYQGNSEGELIDFLQRQGPGCLGIVLNPGALAHYGLSLRDCLEDIARPTIEVHISNVHRREAFRHTLVLSAVVEGQIVGLGIQGYILAAQFLLAKYGPTGTAWEV